MNSAMDNDIDKLVANAGGALLKYMEMTQAEVDKFVHAMTLAGLEAHMRLAEMAVEETKRGVVEDKVIKNMFSTEYIWHSIKRNRTVGIVDENELEGYIDIAEPIGVVAGVTPVTNPTSTTMFKAIICAKTRNPIIFAFHPNAQKCSVAAAQVLYDAAIKNGAPKNCIQWIADPSLDATTALMNHDGVSMILATGGAGMVKSAYSCGKPALGVGPGNVPCYVHKTANIHQAATDIMMSKTFDNGMICASEQAIIIDKQIAPEFEAYLREYNCAFLTPAQIEKLTAFLVVKKPSKNGDCTCSVSINSAAVGQSACWIAEHSGITVPASTKLLICKQAEPNAACALAREKLMPVLAYFTVTNEIQGFAYAKKMLELGGMGHSAVIHAYDDGVIKTYGEKMQVGRIVVNSPSAHGAIGGIYNVNTPSLTLGCGSFGRNSTTANVSSVNLINKKRISKRRTNMQWFKIPPRIYFEDGAVGYLEKMQNISRAFIVTDSTMVKLGYVDKVLYYLRKRADYEIVDANIGNPKGYVHCEVFADVEPDPSVETIMRGVAQMNQFKPDVIIALGGGSPIDAAKGMWLFYEHPDTDFDGLKLKFLDIRKRAYHFPNLGKRAKLVAIPTTSGTGSEITSFSVITDKKNGNVKYPLADYELTPDVAIVDPQFVTTLPKSVIADTGIDVLTHAIEAYVSIMASDYTDGLAMKAIELVFEYLVRSYTNPADKVAREKMHNASTIAGMAFTNSFLGVNHSLAHKLGGEFNIPHGRANAILLPHTIAYNAQKPDKFPVFPKYTEYVADERYAEIARRLNLGGKTKAEQIANLIAAIRDMSKKLNLPATIRECSIAKDLFNSRIPEMAKNAFADQCTTANPRYPLVADLEKIYAAGY
jgi:acetaldehyde dehydrogenase/alcohol dehydrogenase